jgi:pimeloyl-ACP methyl ester carboxylesterase
MPAAARLHYFTSGSHSYDRAPVLLIHGAGGHHLYWPPQVRRISDQRIFAMDLPGHGRSDGIGRDRIEDYFDDVLAFMGAIGLNSAVWIGHSMGGAIALHAALYQPRRVLGLGLVGTGGRLRVDPTLMRHASREATFPALLKLIGERSFAGAADQRLKELAMQRMAEMRSTVLHGDLVACDAFDQTPRLAEILVPTIVICGADDRITPPGASELLHSRIPGSELLVIPDAGHMVMLERPEETANALGHFLNSIVYKPGVSGD